MMAGSNLGHHALLLEYFQKKSRV